MTNNPNLPAALIIGSLIFGVFYYLVQVNQQNIMAKQQRLEIETQKEKQLADKTEKILCVGEAESMATQEYKRKCASQCLNNHYFSEDYQNYYQVCVQRKGID